MTGDRDRTGHGTGSADPHGALPPLALGAPLDEADAALVLIHGRGAPAETMAPLVDALLDGMPGNVAVRLPRAAGAVWYPNRFVAPRSANEPYLGSALQRVGLLLDELASAGIPPERTILGGFSQGACLTLDLFARRGGRLGAVLGLAGGLIGDTLDPDLYADDLAGTPVFIGSGDPDPHIPTGRVTESAELLRAKGARVDARLYPGIGHTVNQDELDASRALIEGALHE